MAQMIFARPDGQWFDFPPLEMAAMSGEQWFYAPAKQS